ncbi:MAG: GAF domain-containing protein, partial [Actinomadura rubrobrunea]|nr:GAF domain-containing protein [Actinomadura rubrobrunea]
MNGHVGHVPGLAPRECLQRLLGTIPTRDPAGDLVKAITSDSGARAVVLAREEDRWTVLAGDAALRRDDDPGRTAVSAGPIVIVLSEDPVSVGLDETVLRQACVWLALAGKEARAAERAAAAADEAAVSRAVVEQIMSVRDLDQVLLSIANQTLRMLESDICGVLLREGDEVCMRSCVGHRLVETSRLRMRRGQGVAGMVFATGKVGKVDSYLQDETISRDFMALAEQEATRSALAVPLRAHGDLIGVLEVWRRRPSVFTARDVRRLVSLADLATIAIENARLYDEQLTMVRELREARDALETQVDVLRRSAALQ